MDVAPDIMRAMHTATIGSPLAWGLFLAAVLVFLALDLGVFHRKEHVVSAKEAGIWTGIWILTAVVFGAGLHLWKGQELALEFAAGYLIEKALSVDNIFVFVVLFRFFKVPGELQHRVLFWGVFGALVLRAVFIFAGASLLDRFDWMLYVFGAILVWTGLKMFSSEDENPSKSPWIRWLKRIVPVQDEFDGKRFFSTMTGKRMATPLFLALVAIEFTDVIFAVDSIPAVFAVSRDPFIVFTSNVFAILGLRSLYFLLADVVDRFYLLRPALALVLLFVGAKMIASDFVHVPVALSLGVIAGLVGGAMIISWLRPKAAAARRGE